MIDFEKLAVAMGELDEDTVKEILEAVDSVEAANAAMEACKNIGADQWAHSPQKTVDTCKAWAET